MKLPLTILILLTVYSCNHKLKEPSKEDSFNVSHGVTLDKVDSVLVKEIRFVHFDSATGVIFPAEYSKKKFGNRTCFTPDTTLIRQVDTEIMNQYCIAMKRFNDAVWVNTIDNLEKGNDQKSLDIAKKQMADDKKHFEKFCPQWQHDLIYWDRQYVGIITEEGDKMIYVQFLDFRQDPYNLKPAFGLSWIGGWHGWFETNTNRLHFHVDKNLLTINEDI